MPRGKVTIGVEMVEHMMALLPAQTNEDIMRTFGISYNSWTKVKTGQPLRASVAHRLLDRLVAARSDGPVSGTWRED